ncbi:MAG: DUF4157 domain-containing protein, partial [Actinophytocola sp.]|uniref:eCIS core domain-containing protein n=1 Tax=Actinophytocola sp. TaxID=1872138 RepID=UPI003C78CD83
VGPAPVLPPLRPSAGKAPEVVSPTGSVTGIARPVARASEPVAEVAVPAPLPPAPVVRRPARSVPAEAPVLTDAVDEYVGEPREAAEPYRAPSWLRFATNPGLPMLPGLPGPAPDLPMSEPPSFLPPELRSTPEPPAATPAPEPPPRMVEGVARAGEPVQRPMRRRRPSLGQSRRLGLGAPIPAPQLEDLIHPEAPPRVVDGAVEPAAPQEPPPPPAAPVRVATEQAPEPAPEQDPEPAPPAEPPKPPEPPEPPKSHTVAPSPPSEGGAPGKRVVATSYRATAELLPPRKRKPLPRARVVGTVVDTVPPDLAHAVRAHQHVDVANVPVYRGEKVGEAAKSRGAKAFASGGAVFLPDEVGPADSPKARGLLAHELVHAVQQRTLGPVLPSPDSPLGQQLEAEAQAAERFYGGEAGAAEPPPLIHAPQQASAHAPEEAPDLTAPAQLFTAPAQAPAPVQAQPVQSPFDPATKAEVGRIAEESARHVVTEWSNPKLEPKEGAKSGATGTQNQQRPVFDRAARKDELVRQTLDIVNQERFEQGKEPLTDLDAMYYERIERQLDDMQNGTTPSATTPQRPSYQPNSKEAWIHGLTGMDPSYGLGLTGFKEEVGSEKSWWGSEDKRPLKQRLLSGFGLADTVNQADKDTWFADEPQQTDGTSATQLPGARDQATASATAGTAEADEQPIAVSRLDLDELSERLYDRLRSRLRLELLVDRERAGLLTDFR